VQNERCDELAVYVFHAKVSVDAFYENEVDKLLSP
jgi:hypothetical protein